MRFFFFGLAALLASTTCWAESPRPLPFWNFEVPGKTIPLTNLPHLKAKWFLPADPDGLGLEVDNQMATLKVDGKRCMHDRGTIVDAFLSGDILTLATSGPNNAACPNVHGMLYRFNLRTKQGLYALRYRPDTFLVFHVGRLELE